MLNVDRARTPTVADSLTRRLASFARLGTSIFANIDCVPLKLTTAAGAVDEIKGPAPAPSAAPTSPAPPSASSVEAIFGGALMATLMGVAAV